jgi:shikimate kinase
MNIKLKLTPGIYLTGFMASGKTTIGRLLADELGWSFVDIDEEIEAEQSVSIAQIFDSRGEAEFRAIESTAIQRHVRAIEKGRPSVVALGGGAFTQPNVAELLEENGITIWLDCPFAIVKARVDRAAHRPLARDAEKFKQLYDDRRASYEKADFRIEISGDDPADAVAMILKLPIF